VRRRVFLSSGLGVLGGKARANGWQIEITQLTFGPKHHFFGYIGHVRNIPWNGSGRYIVGLRTGFQDRMPRPGEAADVILLDTAAGNRIFVIDRTLAWNFQQGTMFYWNPESPDDQFFFNDRDPKTSRVFTVLFDIGGKRRIREYRYPDTPFGNSGVAQIGGHFLGLNYGRMARLRLVTGYPGAFDWTEGIAAPENDGIFRVDTGSGKSRLLVSFRQLAALIKHHRPEIEGRHLFINHTLGNRDGTRVYFYVRADFDDRRRRIDIPCTVRSDGTGLAMHSLHIGGHPEWENGSRIMGSHGDRLVLYDVDRKEIVGSVGSPEIFPNPGGDTALSPDGNWVVNGYRSGAENYYAVFRRSDGTWRRSRGFSHPGFASGDLRVDGSPCWNRTNDQILFPSIAEDGTRQMFLLRILGA
jgi:hypothetical protein